MAPCRPFPRALLACALTLLAACSGGAAHEGRAPGRAVADQAGECTAALPQGDGEPLIRGGGACPDVAAVLSRCAPRHDPVLTFLGANGRRYLGGRFSMPVGAVPSGAAYLGRAGDLEVYREAGARGRVFVADAGGLSRWLELPAPARVAPPTAQVIGDSIALGAEPAIVEALPEWSTSVDAEVGRGSEAGVSVAEAVAGTSPGPSAVVVELGTNDENLDTFVASARSILRTLSGEPLVVWVAPHAPFDVTAEVRSAIDRLVAATPNGVVADWDAAVPSDALSADDVHLLPDRVDVFADFVARDLRAWRMAVAGAGATACAPSS